jgi:hypothetical protein
VLAHHRRENLTHRPEGDGERQHQQAGDGGIEPVVVGRRDDREERDRRVGERNPAPAGAHDDDDADPDDHRPPEVQRRHRRELVGHGLGVIRRVDVGPVDVERVDEAVDHARWSERVDDVDRERGGGDAHQPVPHRAVPHGMAYEQPQHEGDRDREVHADVVAVEERHDRLAAQHERLDRVLRHEPATLRIEHAAGVAERLGGVVAGEEADLPVADEDRCHQRDLASDRPRPRAQRPGLSPDRVLSHHLAHVAPSKTVLLTNR